MLDLVYLNFYPSSIFLVFCLRQVFLLLEFGSSEMSIKSLGCLLGPFSLAGHEIQSLSSQHHVAFEIFARSSTFQLLYFVEFLEVLSCSFTG